MNSIILCEGSDDLWFIAYYLHKTAKWTVCKDPKKYWKYYRVSKIIDSQFVEHYTNGTDCVTIWSVDGKDNFKLAISTIREKFIANYPAFAPDAIVIIRDRDDDDENEILCKMQTWFSNKIVLKNKVPSIFNDVVDDVNVSITITPLIIPFDREGAIETLLMNAIRDSGEEGKAIVDGANNYIDRLLESKHIGIKYLCKNRLKLKARYSATIAVTNPDHSTELFKGMVMACPWEESDYVKRHFGIVAEAITGQINT